MTEHKIHPTDPPSNVPKLGTYDPNKYALDTATLTVRTHECLTPGHPPCLTQQTIGMFLQPLTRELVEIPPRPTIDELPEAVIDRMVQKDKAFWVDKPGANAYTLHDACYNYGMTTDIVKPVHQDVFPRSYQYDLDCVKYRRLHACDYLKQIHNGEKKSINTQCHDCRNTNALHLKESQQASIEDSTQKRWRYYPDLTAALSLEEIQKMMKEVGRPFQNEACNWYNKYYPSVKYECIIRKFSK